jgi:uncharacterized protein YcbX
MPRLASIHIFPFKSFDGQSVDEAVLLPSGCLRHDRRFALVDKAGDFINGKNTPAIHRLRSRFDPAACVLTLQVDGQAPAHAFQVDDDRARLVEWLANYLDKPVSLVENAEAGYPDDTAAPGPTIISTTSLAEVSTWFPGLTLAETRDRFRANLEIDADEPFWEDRLFADGARLVRLRIGEAQLLGTYPCARCPVPTRNPYTGEPIREFAKVFARRRQETLPPWAPASRFDHFYRMAVNTRPVSSRQCTLRVGDELEILGVE